MNMQFLDIILLNDLYQFMLMLSSQELSMKREEMKNIRSKCWCLVCKKSKMLVKIGEVHCQPKMSDTFHWNGDSCGHFTYVDVPEMYQQILHFFNIF